MGKQWLYVTCSMTATQAGTEQYTCVVASRGAIFHLGLLVQQLCQMKCSMLAVFKLLVSPLLCCLCCYCNCPALSCSMMPTSCNAATFHIQYSAATWSSVLSPALHAHTTVLYHLLHHELTRAEQQIDKRVIVD
jgi:hypothetical protein